MAVIYRVRISIMAIAAGLAATLAACGALIPDGEQPGSSNTRKYDPGDIVSGASCRGELDQAGVRYRSLPDEEKGGGCRIVNAVQLIDIGTPVSNLGAMSCGLATRFTAWTRYAVQPAAREFLGSELVQVETFGTYSCRNINGAASGKLSQHAFANAVDVSAFRLADGRRVSVLGDWEGTGREAQFLRAIRASACRRFGTVLSPDYNEAHRDHLHFDMAPRRSGSFCR